MAAEIKPNLYPNQMFKFRDIDFVEKDDTCFTKVFLANGKVYNLKIVEPFPVDKTRTILEGATKVSVEKAVEDIVTQKYTLKTVNLSDEVLDSIEDELDGLKLGRKERRKKQEELEKEKTNELKEIMKKDEIKNFFTPNLIFQANGIFIHTSNNSGLLQIPGDSRFKAKNLHSVDKDNPFVDFTFTDKNSKQVLTLGDIGSMNLDNIKMKLSLNYLTDADSYKDIFSINYYLLKKLSDSKNKKIIPFELYNIIYFGINEELLDEVIKSFKTLPEGLTKETLKEKFKSFFTASFVKPINDIMKPYRQSKDTEKVISETDVKLLETVYSQFISVFITQEIENELYLKNSDVIDVFRTYYANLVPAFIEVNISLFLQNDKKKDFINFLVKNWIDTKDSMFNVIKNKEKKDYFAILGKIKLKKITGILKIVKLYDKSTKESRIHDIYVYPAINNVKTPTPRLISYSIMQDTLVPNVLPPTDGKNRGFVTTIEVIDELRTLCS